MGETTGWVKGKLVGAGERGFRLTESAEETQARKRAMDISEAALRGLAIFSALLGMSALVHSVPSRSVIGMGFGALCLVSAADSWKMAERIRSDPKLADGWQILQCGAKTPKKARQVFVEKKIERLTADTVLARAVSPLIASIVCENLD